MKSTIIALGLYFAIAFVPKVPWYVKVVLQLVLGGVIYFAFTETMFDLPMGDSLPISSIFGGSPQWGDDPAPFNKYAMGVVGTVLGLIATGFATLIYSIFGKKKEE